MPTSIVYCVDTSALIDLKWWYPEDVFAVWDELGKLVTSRRLIAPRQVLEELKRKDDTLLKWVMKHRRMFCSLDEGQIAALQEVESRFPDLVDHMKQIPDADPFVVGLAVARQRARSQDDLFTTHEHVVVTQEKLSAPGGRRRIPNVCQAYGVRWLPLIEMFRCEKWRFATGGV